MPKKRKPIKVRWEWVVTPDAEDRWNAAFDLIFNHLEQTRAGDLQTPSDDDPESQAGQGQLPLF